MAFRLVLSALAVSFALPLAVLAQSSVPAPPEQQPTPSANSQQPGYTLNTGVRIVLADVTVTDKNGNVVHGLPASAFHVTVDSQPRPLLSFEEHNTAPTAIAATPVAGSSTFSNEFLKHLPPVLNIVVLDTSNLGITEQMYLAIEFHHFLEKLPAEQPIAIYARTGEHLVLVQNFTSDHALLKAASTKVMPHLPMPHDPTSDLSLLYDLAEQLTQMPGRKNVLWFSGGSSLLNSGDMENIEDTSALRVVYDQLEAARIALYPIDARGLTVNKGPGDDLQHFQMGDSATATGGQIFYNQNSLKDIAQKVLRQDSSYYTLTVSPKDFNPDNRWHKVHITVEPSGYTLSYGQGFFADGNNLQPLIDAKPDRRRNLLLAGGEKVDTPADIRSSPIIFSASVVPSSQPVAANDSDFIELHAPVPPKRGHIAYSIRYMLPLDAFLSRTRPNGKPQVSFDVAAVAFNQAGEKIAAKGDHVRLTLAVNHPDIPVCIADRSPQRRFLPLPRCLGHLHRPPRHPPGPHHREVAAILGTPLLPSYHKYMSTPLRTAVIGFGFAGKIFHSPFISAVPGLELSAIVTNSTNPARSPQLAAETYPKARILSTPEQAFADPNIDLIVVATPNDSHFELAALAVQAGKHVVVDKPLTTSAESALSLISTAKSNGRVLAPFHNRRFDTDTLTAKKLVTESTLGRVVSVTAHYDRYRPFVRPNTWKESGGIGGVNGLLFDLGPHLIDQAISLFGAPTHITASIRADRDVTDIDDAINISLTFNAGGRPIRYDIAASMLASDPAPRLRIHGTLGSYTKQGLDPQEAALLGGKRPPSLDSQEPWLPEPETSWGTLTLATKQIEPVELSRQPFPSVTGDYRLFYANVRDAIRDKAPLAVTATDGYRVIRLLELALQSSKEQRTLPVTFDL